MEIDYNQLGILICLIQVFGIAIADPYGCFDATIPRKLTVSAGNYLPSDIGCSSCVAACSDLGAYSYAAVTSESSNSYCFCGNQVQTVANALSSSMCSASCSNGQDTCCGSNNTYNIMSLPDISNVSLTLISPIPITLGVVEVTAENTFNTTSTNNAVSLGYTMDFDDGAGTVKTGNSVAKKVYITAGERTIVSCVTGSGYAMEGTCATMTVSVQSPPISVTWNCPEMAGTQEEMCCNATILAGSYMTAAVDFIDSQETIAVADTEWEVAGTPVEEVTDSDIISGGNDLYIIDYQEFTQASRILYFEFLSMTPAGNVKIVVLSPLCSSGTSYCYRTHTCAVTCPSVTCPIGKAFGVPQDACVDVSTPVTPAVVDRYSSKPGDLRVKSVTDVIVNIVATGPQIVDVINQQIDVMPGDVIGWVSSGANIATRLASGQERGVYSSTMAIVSEGSTVSTGTISSTRNLHVHFLRAVASKSSLLLACHTYMTAGVFPVSLNLSNSLLQNYTTLSTEVNIVEGINDTSLIHDAYGRTGNGVVFTIAPHTGSNITYEWHFGDGKTNTTSIPTINHVYDKSGTYTLNVTATNAVSTHSNSSTIIIQDPILDLNVTGENGSTHVPLPVSFTVSSGSDCTCWWDFGDGQTDQGDCTATNKTHIFTKENVYVVNITCSNMVSVDSATVEVATIAAITDLKLVTLGGFVNEQIQLIWGIATGSNVSFTCLFNNESCSFAYDETTKLANANFSSIQQTGYIPLTIHAWNIVSNERLDTNFTIEERITNPMCCSQKPVINLVVDDPLIFNCTMDGGTSVTVLWEYGDGIQDVHESPNLERWVNGQMVHRTHIFNTTGCYNSTTTTSNNAGSETCAETVCVYDDLKNISISVDSPVIFSEQNFAIVSNCFTSTTPLASKGINVVIDWGDNSNTNDQLTFSGQCFNHQYTNKGTHNIQVVLSNPVTSRTLSASVELLDIPTNMQIFANISVPISQAMNVCLTLDKGDLVTFTCDLDYPSGIAQTQLRTATNPFKSDCFTQTYTVVGTHTIQCVGSNPLMNVTRDFIIDVQQPIQKECYEVVAIPEYTTFPDGTFTLQLNDTGLPGCKVPQTAVSMNVFWDGSTNNDCTENALEVPKSWNNTYEIAAEHECTVRLCNDVSSVDYILKCGVYKRLSDMVIQATYTPEYGNAIPGHSLAENNFPVDRPVEFSFKALIGTVGNVTVIGINANNSIVVFCTSSCADSVAMTFPTPGTYNITYTAINPLGSISDTFIVHMSVPPKDLAVSTSSRQYSPGETITIHTTTGTIGEQACYYVNVTGCGPLQLFGDLGTCTALGRTGEYKGPWDHKMVVNANCEKSQPLTTVTCCGENYVTTMPVCKSTSISITVGCIVPAITINDARPVFTAASELGICRLQTVRAKITLSNATNDLQNNKEWTVERVNDTTGEILHKVHMAGRTTNPAIYIPKGSLQPGIYKFRMEVTLSGSSGMACASAATTYIRMADCPLETSIIGPGVTSAEVGVNKMVTFNLLNNTFDPNVVDLQQQRQGLTCTLRCRKSNEIWPIGKSQTSVPIVNKPSGNTIDHGGCFKQGPGLVETINGVVTFNTGAMEENVTYVFESKCTKGSLEATFVMSMTVLSGDVPLMTIIPISQKFIRTSKGITFIDSTEALRLLARQPDWGSNVGIDFQWDLCYDGPGVSSLYVSNFERYARVVTSQDIAIDAKIFSDKKEEYGAHQTFKVILTASKEGGMKGTTTTSIMLNEPPSQGSCDIDQRDGTSLKTKFTIDCSNWYDSDGITGYTIYAAYVSENTRRVVPVKEIPETFTPWTGFLPSGVNAITDVTTSNVTLTVTIADKLGGKTYYDLGIVTVSLPLQNELRQIADSQTSCMEEYNRKVAEGDRGEISELALTCASVGQAATWLLASEASCDILHDPVCRESNPGLAEELSRQAETLNSIINDLSDATELVDPASAITTLQVLTELTATPETLTFTSQAVVSNMITAVTDLLKTSGNTFSREEIDTIGKAVVEVLDNVNKAFSSSKDNPTLGEKDKISKDDNVTYFNPSLQGQDPDLSGMSIEEANRAIVDQGVKRQAAINALNTYLMIQNINKQLTLSMAAQSSSGEGLTRWAAGGNDLLINTNVHTKVLNSKLSISEDTEISLGPLTSLVPGLVVNDQTRVTLSTYVCSTNLLALVASESLVTGSLIMIDLYLQGSKLNVTNSAQPITITSTKTNPVIMGSPSRNSTNSTGGRGERDSENFQNFNVTDFPRMSHIAELPHNQTNASVLIELKPYNLSERFMVLCQCNRFSTWDPTRTAENTDGAVFYSHTGDRIRDTWLLSATYMRDTLRCHETKTRENVKVFITIYQLNHTDCDNNRTSNQSDTQNNCSSVMHFTNGYWIKTEFIGCYYLNTVTYNWEPIEASPAMAENTSQTSCATRHLSSFSSGVAVAPNPIDWDFVFANLDFFKNMTLYITEIVILVLYIISVIWARRQDNKDIEKLGLTPLIGNKPEDRYLYELFIATGHRSNAGTESKVYIILSGDYDETEAKQIAGPGRKRLLQRGSADGILLATNRPLGSLNYLRAWHDNSGKGNFASWYLKHIMVQDLQTKEKYFFICDQWFAVEQDDGQVDRVIPVAGEEQMTEFAHLFSTTSQKGLGDDHLWYSVMARPPESRFTRVQRVSCCLLLLFTNMLANAMFYERAKTGTSAPFTLGPFSLTLEQLYVGMMTNVIIFPINFIVVNLFRKAPPRRKRKSRVQEALEAQEHGSDLITKDEGGEFTGDQGKRQLLTSPTPRSATMIELETKPHSPTVRMAAGKPKTKKKKKFQLPWWCKIIAWLLLWGGVLASAYFVTMYGVMFGDVKCKKWISSMVVSFATSIFLTQPLQVLLMAMLFSAIFKKPNLDREEAEEDEEMPPLEDNEEWVLPHPEEGYPDARPSKLNYQPPDPSVLEAARELRLKELKMYDIMREIVFYCFFLWLLLVVSYSFRPPIGFKLKEQVRSNFIDQGLGYQATFMEDFMKVATHQQFWNWMQVTFLPGLLAGKWYNGWWVPVSRGFLADRSNRIMGFATMRQLRVKPNTCQGLRMMQTVVPQCNEEYSFSLEDTADYLPSWIPRGPNDTSQTYPHYTYRTTSELDGYPFYARHGFYDGGGYVVELTGSLNELKAKIKKLIQERWIDRYTRAVFLELTTYNPGVNLFSVITIVGEFVPSGGMFPLFRVEPISLLTHLGPMAVFELLVQVLYGCFIVFFFIKEARNMHRQGRQYFSHFWNWVELLIIFLSVSGAVIFVYRLTVVNQLTAKFKETHGNGYVKFQYVAYWQELLLYMVGWLVFLANLKFLKLLRFNRRMSMLAATLKHGARPLCLFYIMFWVVFFAFVQFFYFIYFKELTNFKTIMHATETCVQMMLGRFNFHAMHVASPFLGSIFFFIYIIACAYILLNMFVSILIESFTSVRMDITKQSNEHEMVEFIMNRFKTLIGLGIQPGIGTDAKAMPGQEYMQDDEDDEVAPSLEFNIEHFPQKIDRLLNCISKVYFERNRPDDLYAGQDPLGGAAAKAILKRMENKDEMRRVMTHMMLTSFVDPTNVKDVQKDFDMI